VEIGGGFRIPDVIVQGGARLVEVGTTNRTRVADYESALGPDTAAILKVHKSNFDVVGFTEEASVAQLSGLARTADLPLVVDLGSGAMVESYGPGLTGEPVVRRAVVDGADVVCFSGDKLFGGPQAGIILGSSELIRTIRSHPLMRAVRPCKLTLAALEATFELWRDGRLEEIPTARMLGLDSDNARRRTLTFRRRVVKAMGEGWTIEVQEVMGRAGGGSMPLRAAPGWAIALRSHDVSPDAVESALRDGSPPVIARIADDWIILDLRTVLKGQETLLVTRLEHIAKALRASG
jgi:L-seryl-tRNA(Ser) seleniumtransferase